MKTNSGDNHGGTQGHYNQRVNQYDRNKGKQSTYQGNREKSGQRDRSGNNQHPDSSVGHDRPPHRSGGDGITGGGGGGGYFGVAASCAQYNLGAVKFTPGQSTKELPPIETKLDGTKKFSGRCRLFIGNLPHNTTEEKLKKLFDRFGEVGEIYLGAKSAFAFIKMDTRQSAEAARDALDCTMFEGRSLRVRLAAHAAAIRIKNLSSQVTNELLAYAFRYFGEIERAVVVVDDKGRSVGEGIVEYSRKQSALFALKRCQQECFLITSSPRPVLVEPYDQQDDDEGLPEKAINKHSREFQEQREVGPRFAEQGSFEQTYGMKWKELYEVEKQKRENLEKEIEEGRKNLQDQIDFSKIEHDTVMLKNQLRKLEDDRIRLQQLKERGFDDSFNSTNQYEHMMMNQNIQQQRNEDLFNRQQQQMGAFNDNPSTSLQEATLRMQAGALKDLLSQKNEQSDANNTTSGLAAEPEPEQPPMHPMMGAPIPSLATSYADASMVGMSQPSYVQVQPQQMGYNQQGMFAAYMQPTQNQIQMSVDGSGISSMIPAPPLTGFGTTTGNSTAQRGAFRGSGWPRQTTFRGQYRNNNNNTSNNNNSDLQSQTSNDSYRGGMSHNGRPRKRGKY